MRRSVTVQIEWSKVKLELHLRHVHPPGRLNVHEFRECTQCIPQCMRTVMFEGYYWLAHIVYLLLHAQSMLKYYIYYNILYSIYYCTHIWYI